MYILEHYPQLQSFLSYLQFEKRYAQNTVQAYQKDLEQFFAYIISQYDAPKLDAIDAALIKSWLVEMKQEDISSRSLNRKISSLKSFFKYQMKMGVLVNTPMTKIISPKIGKRLPTFVEQNDVQKLFLMETTNASWKEKTSMLIIKLFYFTGMRVSELASLKESQLDNSYKTIKVFGKGSKERIIPLEDGFSNQLHDYTIEKKKKGFEEATLFVAENGKPYKRSNIYTIINTLLSTVTTVQKKSPHVMRHSFATHILNNGGDINAVKELLGHTSLASTQVYTHNSIERLKEVFKNAHPKA